MNRRVIVTLMDSRGEESRVVVRATPYDPEPKAGMSGYLWGMVGTRIVRVEEVN